MTETYTQQGIQADSLNGSKPVDTGQVQDTRFKLGKSGNPLGRPLGSRNKLTDTFITDLHALWLTHGNQALTDMLEDSPTKFCLMVSTLLPKGIEISTDDNMTWVINAAPRLTEGEWIAKHALEAPVVDVSDTEPSTDT